ncbi:hypothetical protein F5Y17DRAFT_464178 [Xylariaceae sp. FL0594]|nr:hypothetical protein F5Y17DRAFT_464178 [Xylariaceae sp. FL0594]
MEDSSPRRKTSWRPSKVYDQLFRSQPGSRKITKRSSLPLPDSDAISPLSSAEDSGMATSGPGPGAGAGHNVSFETFITSSCPLYSPVTRYPAYLVRHQRSRSESATIIQPGYGDNTLDSWHLRAPVTSYSVITTHAPTSARFHSEIPPRQPFVGAIPSVAGMDHSGYGPTGPAYAQQFQRQSRPSVAVRGNYAQIDRQAAMYQRRTSSASSLASSVGPKDTFDAILASPTSSRTSVESWHSASQQPYNGWQRPAPIKQHRKKRREGELFAQLPEEVLALILRNLKEWHMKPANASCATCMTRDLGSVAVSAKKFLKVARIALYEDIQLVGADSQAQKKRLKISFGARLVLLRRTLRSRPAIAGLVRSLKAPAIPQGASPESYQNLVASVIMACPNLERLVGFHQSYNFTFNRLFHALSTRENLREMHWTLEASQAQKKSRFSNAASMLSSGNPDFQEAPGNLLPEQSDEFRDLHMNWTRLETLSIHCLPGATLTPVSLLPDILADVASLKHLHLSHLPFTAFNDANLLSLPALETLTLSHLPGVSSMGLSSFARRPSSRSIRRLTLNHLDVDSLPVIAQILSHLASLETFTFVQTRSPVLPEGEIIWLFPYLASRTIRKLHWDVPSYASTANIADSILAKSIAASGFPALRTLRTPSDPEGIFQALCKPLERIDSPNDRYRGLIAKAGTRPKSPPQTPTTPTTPRTPGSMSSKSGFGLNFPMDDQLFPSKVCSNLSQSRLDAQRRLEAARNEPRFTFRLVDEGGKVLEMRRMAGFLGSIGSPINYCLTPDPGALDENGGLVTMSDFLGDGGEKVKDGAYSDCNGRWKTIIGSLDDKKDRDRWWHTERGRWRAVQL